LHGVVRSQSENVGLVMPAFFAIWASGDNLEHQKARNLRAFSTSLRTRQMPRTAWLGREDSNLRMAESKSPSLRSMINTHSELSRYVLKLRTLQNIRYSEYRYRFAQRPPFP
jgi:hypothetical protein